MANSVQVSGQRLMTKAKAAHVCGVSTRTIDRWTRDERLKFPKPAEIRGRVYYGSADIEAWMRERLQRGEVNAGA